MELRKREWENNENSKLKLEAQTLTQTDKFNSL